MGVEESACCSGGTRTGPLFQVASDRKIPLEGLDVSPEVVQIDESFSSDLFLDPFSGDWEPLCFIIASLQRPQLLSFLMVIAFTWG